MTNYEDFDEDSMPCPCQRCGEWFDQPDGYGSRKWYLNTIICADCHSDEEKEIELDDEIENIEYYIQDRKTDIENAEEEILNAKENIKEYEARLEEIYKIYKPE